MSLILKALEKAKSMAGRKPAAPPHPAALASFRFGRKTKARRTKKLVMLGVLPILVVGAGAGYGIRYWMKQTSRPAAVVLNAPTNFEHAAPATQTEPPPAAEPVAQPEPTPEPAQEQAAPPALQTASAASPYVPARPNRAPRRRRALATPAVRNTVDAPVEPAQNDAADPSYTAPDDATTSAVASPVTVARNGFELAVFYQRSGEYTKALEQYQKLLERDPLNASVYLNLGLLYQAMSNNLEALKAFRQAILINPNYDKAHNNLGIALMNSGQNSEAEREFNRALQINPKSTEAITNLALVAQKSGNNGQAKTQLLRVIQMSPNNAEAHYNLASLYEEEGEMSRAVEHYRKFLDEGSSSYPDLAVDVERKIQELSKRKEQF